MGDKIRRREPIERGLWRLLDRDIEEAFAELSGNGGREERIHRARQKLKRVRSLVRVLKPAIGEKASIAKEMLSGAARLLARARDADAAAASARGLLSAAPDSRAIGLDKVVEEFDRRANEAHSQSTPIREVEKRLGRARTMLRDAARDGGNGTRLLTHALGRSYRKGRKAMRRAETSLATPDLHRWRKSVKDLWHLLRLARKHLPRRAERDAADLARLAEALGLDHDHAMLAERLALSPSADPALMRQLALIAQERRRLEKEAFAIGARLYRRSPGGWARKVKLR
ncbi:MAG TPA: CHAD domain-containing protein [Bauldia sp.]|nr:CHAD domain-containing protein [Bauldia sp.]